MLTGLGLILLANAPRKNKLPKDVTSRIRDYMTMSDLIVEHEQDTIKPSDHEAVVRDLQRAKNRVETLEDLVAAKTPKTSVFKFFKLPAKTVTTEEKTPTANHFPQQ